METLAKAGRRSINEEWAGQSVRVAVARAQSWRDSAFLALAAHSVAEQRPVRPGGFPDLTRRDAELRHHMATLVEARKQMSDVLHSLEHIDLPQELVSQRDAVQLSCADLDAYIERYQAAPLGS